MSKRTKTRTITLAATKGGVGKSTLTTALAVRAMQDGGRVAVIDADVGQNSLSRWHELRGNPDNPDLLKVTASPEGLGLVASKGYAWLMVDTPPRGIDEISQAISVADFVLIPTLAAAFDVEAVDQVVKICELYDAPFAFVINAAQPRWTITREARAFLSEYGQVLGPLVTYRRAYIAATTLGKTGPEYDKDGKCATEISALWSAIRELITSAEKVR